MAKSAIIISIMTNHIVLFEPRIHFNTGNIARTCAATNTHLHLIRPFGFEVTDKNLKRAGLDYWHKVDITYHDDLNFMTCLMRMNIITSLRNSVWLLRKGLYTEQSNHYFLRRRYWPPVSCVNIRSTRIPMNDNTLEVWIYQMLQLSSFTNVWDSNVPRRNSFTYEKIN